MPDHSDIDGETSLVPSADTSQAVQVLLDGLNWVYTSAIDGRFGLTGAEEAANEYLAKSADVEGAISSLIAWQATKASAASFVAGLGGLVTLPIAIPANLAGVLFIQLKMVAGLAHLRGHDIRSDEVKTFALACLAGSGSVDLLKDAGVRLGMKFAAQAIKAIPRAALSRINQAVGFRLVTRAGTTGVVNLSKLVPFVGGLVGGAIDGATTRAIGSAAKTVFPAIPSSDQAAPNAMTA